MRSHLLKSSHTVIGKFFANELPLAPTPIPGVNEAVFEVHAEQLFDLLLAGKRPNELAIHIEPEAATFELRSTLADSFRKHGLYVEARNIRNSPIPEGYLCVVINTDRQTSLRMAHITQVIPPEEWDGLELTQYLPTPTQADGFISPVEAV